MARWIDRSRFDLNLDLRIGSLSVCPSMWNVASSGKSDLRRAATEARARLPSFEIVALPEPKVISVGTEITGPVTSVTDFGVFVKLEEGIEGLVYSSELANERIETPSEHFQEGQDVTALVTKVEPADQKISLSIRAVDDKAERAALKAIAAEQSASQTTTLGDLLKEKLAAKDEENGEEDAG